MIYHGTQSDEYLRSLILSGNQKKENEKNTNTPEYKTSPHFY